MIIIESKFSENGAARMKNISDYNIGNRIFHINASNFMTAYSYLNRSVEIKITVVNEDSFMMYMLDSPYSVQFKLTLGEFSNWYNDLDENDKVIADKICIKSPASNILKGTSELVFFATSKKADLYEVVRIIKKSSTNCIRFIYKP